MRNTRQNTISVRTAAPFNQKPTSECNGQLPNPSTIIVPPQRAHVGACAVATALLASDWLSPKVITRLAATHVLIGQ